MPRLIRRKPDEKRIKSVRGQILRLNAQIYAASVLEDRSKSPHEMKQQWLEERSRLEYFLMQLEDCLI